MDLSNIPTQVLLDEIERRKQFESGHAFKVGDKVRNKKTGEKNTIRKIDDKNYYFFMHIDYLLDDWDGFSIDKESDYELID